MEEVERKILREEMMEVEGGAIPVTLISETYDEDDEPYYFIEVDGIEWVGVENQMHAAVMFNMMLDHLTEYMQYKVI